MYETPHYAYRLGEYTAPEGGTLRRVISVDGASIVRTGSEAGTVIAIPLFSRFALGGTLKYAYYTLRSTPTAQQLPRLHLCHAEHRRRSRRRSGQHQPRRDL